MATLTRQQLKEQFKKQVAKSFSQPQTELPPVDFYTFMKVYAATLANAGSASLFADSIAKALKVYGSTDAEISAVMREVGLSEYQSEDADTDRLTVVDPQMATMSLERRGKPSAIDRTVDALTRDLRPRTARHPSPFGFRTR